MEFKDIIVSNVFLLILVIEACLWWSEHPSYLGMFHWMCGILIIFWLGLSERFHDFFDYYG